MNPNLNTSIGARFSSKSQRARVITEDWVNTNAFCPICGNLRLSQFKASRPVADFHCGNCESEFELKSKESANGKLPTKINDGAYDTMISRITSMNNPHLLMLIHGQN
ncbi:MAG: DpnI domain-containing protein, partial [Synergistaceae bacterium]|nr:DpnI domain-containing protein [Synergistaceae bacterium]